MSAQSAPVKRTARAKSRAISATKTKKTAPTKGRLKIADEDKDKEDEVSVVGFTTTNTVPVPGFLAVAFMETYKTDPLELCLLAVDAIKTRAAAEPDKRKAARLAAAAAYVLHWLLSVAINMIGHPEPDHYGVGTAPPYCQRSAEWTRAMHEKFLAINRDRCSRRTNIPAHLDDRKKCSETSRLSLNDKQQLQPRLRHQRPDSTRSRQQQRR